MKTIIIFYLLFIPLVLPAQENAGIIYPGTYFYNRSTDTLFCLPKQKIETLMAREEITTVLIKTLKSRITESDSMINLKTLESQGWYNKLLENDKLLEESEIIMVKERQKTRNRSKVWFGVGIISSLIIGVIF